MNVHFLTFASSDWVKSPVRYKTDLDFIANTYGFFKTYDIWNEHDLNREYIERFYKYFSDHGFAYFSWKPYSIR